MRSPTTRGRFVAILVGLLLGSVLGTALKVAAQSAGGGVTYIPFSSTSTNTWTGAQTFSQPITVNGAGSVLKGGVTIATPSAGSAQTINGLPGTAALKINQGDSASVSVRIQDPGVNGIGIDLDTTNTEASIRGFGTNGTFGIYTNGSQRISVANGGAVTVNAPSSGTAVTITGVSGQLAVSATQPTGLPAFTVATLPTCNATLKGGMAYVTDASSPTYNGALTGSSSTIVPVFCNGSAWTAH